MQLSSPVRLLSSSDGSSTSNEAAVLGITYGPRGEVCLTTADAMALMPLMMEESDDSDSVQILDADALQARARAVTPLAFGTTPLSA